MVECRICGICCKCYTPRYRTFVEYFNNVIYPCAEQWLNILAMVYPQVWTIPWMIYQLFMIGWITLAVAIVVNISSHDDPFMNPYQAAAWLLLSQCKNPQQHSSHGRHGGNRYPLVLQPASPSHNGRDTPCATLWKYDHRCKACTLSHHPLVSHTVWSSMSDPAVMTFHVQPFAHAHSGDRLCRLWMPLRIQSGGGCWQVLAVISMIQLRFICYMPAW